MIITILTIVVITIAIMWIAGVIYLVTKGKVFKQFYHNILEWHIPDDLSYEGFDGCSIHSVCKICGKEIMQDSQGNWF